MNTEQLQCVLRENKCLSVLVNGVYSPDTLPEKVTSYPSAYICNTDYSYLPGRHWVVFWFKSKDYGEFYDSFGQTPKHYKIEFEQFLQRNVVSYVYNNIPLQNARATVCGYHVLYFLLMKCFGLNMKDMTDFLKTLTSPDQYVYQYVSEYFDCV